jgi:anti-sigma regulatory factor (Ser/Thr protein kinase)
MEYEEKETIVQPGETVVFYSDGLVEAHNAQRDMFSFGRLQQLVAEHGGGAALIEFLLRQLADFTGPAWEQEDDVTLVTLERTPVSAAQAGGAEGEGNWQTLATFAWSSEPGNERLAMAQVAEAVAGLGLPPARLERLKTGVAEATMNAMEHGNKFRPEVPVDFVVRASPTTVSVMITDRGAGPAIPEVTTPDLEAKLAGLQKARGWGLFLIEKMVDEVRVTTDETSHTVELIMHREGDGHGH